MAISKTVISKKTVAANTGNTYIPEIKRDSIEIPMAKLELRPRRARKKCRQVIATATDNRK